jgi:Ca2+-binding RTX toxin-like protein
MAKIVGTSGNDILNGVNGTDNLIYGDSDGTIDPSGGIGNDTITGGTNATNTIFGDAETLMGVATTGGNDTLIGGVNSTNLLVGDANSTAGAPMGGTTPSSAELVAPTPSSVILLTGVAVLAAGMTVSLALIIPQIACGAISSLFPEVPPVRP